jgi:hypothetical protein
MDYRPRGFSANDFLGWHRRDELVLQPRFQRRKVWVPKARSHLIDTILRGLPMPIIFLREHLDPDTRRTIREVVDGQQRLRTVIDYVGGEFPIMKAHNADYGGKMYDELPEDAQRRLLEYEFCVVVLIGAEDSDVLQIFSRLNTYTERLNAQELRNAQFYGPFKQTIYEVARAHLTFWRESGVLSDRSIMRMGDAELTSELVAAMLKGLQDGKASLRRFYTDYDDEFAEQPHVVAEFSRIIDDLAQTFAGELRRTAFRRKAMFYSLFCIFYDLAYSLPNSTWTLSGQGRLISATQRRSIREALQQLSNAFEAHDPRLRDLLDAASHRTDRISARRLRHSVLCEVVGSAL